MHDSCASGSTPLAGDPVDARIAALAQDQHGVLSLPQLGALGLGRGSIAHRIKIGRLHRIHPGVYAVGHEIVSLKGRFMAATLALGPAAVISHRSAAILHGMLESAAARIDVSSPGRRSPGRSIRAHQTRTLAAQDVTTLDGVPVTSIARTLLDLADVAPARHVERALHQAEILRAFDLTALEDVLARANGRRGAKILRQALAQHKRGPTLTRSELEEAFLAIIDRAGLARPRMNTKVRGYTVDAYWPERRLIVEIDSYKYHRSRSRFESDRRRDVLLQSAGLRTARFTDMRIEYEPVAVEHDLRALVDSRQVRSS
jgi:predicted transcriptional regulator of viral defense system